jgi:hypothetical protein
VWLWVATAPPAPRNDDKKSPAAMRGFCFLVSFYTSNVEEDGFIIALQDNVECIDRLAILL